MADVPAPNGTAKLAIGFAVVAVIVVAVAVTVVAMRGGKARAVGAGSARVPVMAAGPEVVVVDAHDVVRIDRGTVDSVMSQGTMVGIKINDPELLAALKLEATDVITAISGKEVRRQFDVNDVLSSASMMNATALYVELLRGGKPLLLKWELEGDLHQERSGAASRMRVPTTPLAPDPLGDTIKRVTDFEFELPRTTLWQIDVNLQSGMSPGVRPVPAIRNGLVEGVKLYAIRPGSVWAALGLKTGDTIMSANNRPILMANLRDELDRVRNVGTIELAVMRRGKLETLKYSITK